MGKVKELSVLVRQVKNLGNYQTLTAEAQVTVVLNESEDVDLAFIDAWSRVNREVAGQLKSTK